MPLEPAPLVQTYTRGITACRDLASLRNLLTGQVLPSLLVRQSALLRLEPLTNNSAANGLQPLILYGVSADQMPATDQVQASLDHAGRYLPPGSHPGWVRLAIPLFYGDQLRWLWLFGQHDPDDVYTQFEIDRLQTLVGSTALALANQEMARTLVALYQAGVNRHEEERQRIARYLHDDLLNELGVLSANLDLVNAPEFISRSIPRAIKSVRQLIHELRPPLLMYGLHMALRSLIDDIEDRSLESASKVYRPHLVLDLAVTVETYDPQVDLHLFRIAQQAVNNALRHAQAQTISLRGQLAAEQVTLVIEDDGRGFPSDEQLDLSSLLANKHYGLVNMYERAEMIGAELRVSSTPGKGVRVECKWEPATFALQKQNHAISLIADA
jgi:signal transduction histidine kinase